MPSVLVNGPTATAPPPTAAVPNPPRHPPLAADPPWATGASRAPVLLREPLVAPDERTPGGAAPGFPRELRSDPGSAAKGRARGTEPDAEREMLFETFRVWQDSDASVRSAAEVLICHPNTVRHRLRRIERRTSRSLDR